MICGQCRHEIAGVPKHNQIITGNFCNSCIANQFPLTLYHVLTDGSDVTTLDRDAAMEEFIRYIREGFNNVHFHSELYTTFENYEDVVYEEECEFATMEELPA